MGAVMKKLGAAIVVSSALLISTMSFATTSDWVAKYTAGKPSIDRWIFRGFEKDVFIKIERKDTNERVTVLADIDQKGRDGIQKQRIDVGAPAFFTSGTALHLTILTVPEKEPFDPVTISVAVEWKATQF
jgi:hypothetical protein